MVSGGGGGALGVAAERRQPAASNIGRDRQPREEAWSWGGHTGASDRQAAWRTQAAAAAAEAGGPAPGRLGIHCNAQRPREVLVGIRLRVDPIYKGLSVAVDASSVSGGPPPYFLPACCWTSPPHLHFPSTPAPHTHNSHSFPTRPSLPPSAPVKL